MRGKLIMGVVLAALGAAGLGFGLWPRAQVLTLTGTVDGNEVVVGSQITATIMHMAVEDGEAVHAGQVIATLSQNVQTADVQAAEQAVAQAQASARQSEAQTALLAAELPAKLQQAQAQQQQAQAQLAQAQAQVQAAQAAWVNAHATYARVAPLEAQGVSSQQDLDNA
ncbi:MAG: TolC family protein, partial [Terriglobales bacterium]